MPFLVTILIFFLGAVIGSFLGVALDRYNTGKTMGGRSVCFSCKRTLRGHEMVPILSWMFLGGKCAGCKSKVSAEYPILETCSGLVFVAVAHAIIPLYGSVSALHFFATGAYYVTLFSIFLVIAFYDVRHMIIPEKFVWTAAILAFFGMYVVRDVSFISDVLAGPILAAPFALLWFLSRGRLMGLGDAKLMLPIGWMLGLSTGVVGLLFAFWIGAVVSVILLIASGKRFKMKTEIPFAPYLILGAYLAFACSITLPELLLKFY